MKLLVRIYTRFFGEMIGQDEFGNRYFVKKICPNYSNKKSGSRKRWVIYQGIEEASKIPALWHRWLHYVSDEIPNSERKKFSWQKEHLANFSGTKSSYQPENLSSKPHSSYQAWDHKNT